MGFFKNRVFIGGGGGGQKDGLAMIYCTVSKVKRGCQWGVHGVNGRPYPQATVGGGERASHQ